MSDTPLTIAWVGGQFFMHEVEALGHRVVRLPLTGPGAYDWQEITERCQSVPDAVVYTDRSLPPPLLGVERMPCLTAFYCIDSHIHSWYPLYAGAFDLCATSLHDDVPRFAAELAPSQVLWLPPFAEDRYQPRPEVEPDLDLLFVGTVDQETTPQRHAFLQRLGGVFPELAVLRGDFSLLFPRARVVLNIAERGDLNFRVMEALACGSCLLTPRISNGQSELFTEGVHFVCYESDNEEDAAQQARTLLANAPLRRSLAQAGCAQVNAAHRPKHRAEVLVHFLREGMAKTLPQARLATVNTTRAQALRLLFLHWAEHCGSAELAARYLREARALNNNPAHC